MRILALLGRIKGIIPMFKDKEVKWWKKVLIIAAIIYLVLPVDLIPPIVPVFGWLDDIIIWIALLYFMGPDLDKYVVQKSGNAKKYNYKDSDVTEAEFTVHDEEEEEANG